MRVVFMGTPDFAVPTLDAIVEAGHEVVLVVAQPDRKSGRGQRTTAPPVARRAKELGLPLSQPRAIRTGSFPNRLEALDADVAVVLAYGRILTERLLTAPRLGCINVHASLLPRWRGAAPIQAAILAGDSKTGVCTQQMEEGLDTGPLFHQLEIDIAPRETAGTLHDKLMVLSANVAVETLDNLAAKTPSPQAQAGVCWAPKIAKEDGRVDWTLPAAQIDRQIRAMSPWPGGWSETASGRLKIIEASPISESGASGTIVKTSPQLVIGCGQGSLCLHRVQAPGRKPVTGREYANGARFEPNQEL